MKFVKSYYNDANGSVSKFKTDLYTSKNIVKKLDDYIF